ncbi:glycosyltransferase [Mangrovicoccus sp. HB161399]|uniref:glycosyltransferase n=1 Tax=Mangrovicoccus sp. HB161399 TaxID=2720392 RepID=UPI001551A90B|nr:glycosyltransferase [Mangrovicoccus sp. HB161399]
MQPLTHVLMTRFNLATPGRESSLRNRPGWLRGRFELFERYCLPSVAAQDVPDLKWIIYFDKNTPPEFRSRVEELRRVFPFEPYYTGLFLTEGWGRSLNERFGRTTPLLLTTRLDNDDALAVDFAARLQAEVRARDGAHGVYNFANGYVMGNGALYRMRHESNPFFSCLSDWTETPVTAPGIHHMAIAEHGKLTQIEGRGAWLQVIHDGNVSNKIRGRRIAPEEIAGLVPETAFAELRPAGPMQILLENSFLTPLRDTRDRLLALRRAKRA